jgi:hypothetical protein
MRNKKAPAGAFLLLSNQIKLMVAIIIIMFMMTVSMAFAMLLLIVPAVATFIYDSLCLHIILRDTFTDNRTCRTTDASANQTTGFATHGLTYCGTCASTYRRPYYSTSLAATLCCHCSPCTTADRTANNTSGVTTNRLTYRGAGYSTYATADGSLGITVSCHRMTGSK